MVSVLAEIEQKAEVRQAATSCSRYLDQAQELEVCDASTAEYAVKILSEIAEAKKTAEGQRKIFTEPLLESKRAIDNFFKRILEPFEQADKLIRAKVLTYRQEEAQRAQVEAAALQKKREEEAKKTGQAFVPPVVATSPANTLRAENGSATVRKTWDFLVESEADVPREFLVVDDRKIRAAIGAGIRSIPGVKIFQKETLSVR